MRRVIHTFLLLCMISFLSGCLYPQEKKLQLDQLESHVSQVQSAVELYQKEKKVLPYRYQADEIKFTSKATVDFKELQGYINQIPPSSFEKGGYFLYVLTNVEEKPLVRLFDLRLSNQVDKVQTMVMDYQQKKKQLPIKEKITEGIYTIDYQKLNMDEITVPSPYDTQANLSFIMDGKGRVRVDYRTEVMKMIQTAKQKPAVGEDLRFWMAKQSLYVPAFSLPMKYENNEPVFTSI